MDFNNIMILCSFENNSLISKNQIESPERYDWNSFDDFKSCFKINYEKMKYFDDEGELISVINREDFTMFKELTLKKQFPDDQVIVLLFEGSLDIQKYGDLEKILNLNVEKRFSNSFEQRKSTTSTNNSVSLHRANSDSSSSSSSSSSFRKNQNLERKKKSKTMNRYAARLKKELNYLPGSEVSDGQTIVKKWRIKNIGSKKWKENTVISVLLPSKYNQWVTCSDLKVPCCFADQKVDIEVEIQIKGQWEDSQSSEDQCSRNISLTWLLFNDCLVTRRRDNFKDYILAQLELSITVKKKGHETGFQTWESNAHLERHQSSSSIERIDQEYAIVDRSAGEVNDNRKNITNVQVAKSSSDNIIRMDTVDIDLELQDCPQGDDFQISDFIAPNGFIQVEPDDFLMLSYLSQSDNDRRLISAELTDNSMKTEISFSETSDKVSDHSDHLTPDKEPLQVITATDVSLPSDGEIIDDSNNLKITSITQSEDNIPASTEKGGVDVSLPEIELPASIDENRISVLSNENDSCKLTNPINNVDEEPHNECHVKDTALDSDKEDSFMSAEENEIDEHKNDDKPVNEVVPVGCDWNGLHQISYELTEELIRDAAVNNDSVTNVSDYSKVNGTELLSKTNTISEPLNPGFVETMNIANAPRQAPINYPQGQYAAGIVQPGVTMPYQAGCPYPQANQPNNYAPNVGSGWGYPPGVIPPYQHVNHPHAHGYSPAHPGIYQPGVVFNHQAGGIYPRMPINNQMQGARYIYPQPNNPAVRYSQPSAPNANIGDYSRIGFR